MLPGQSWDPASPISLTILLLTEELLVLVLPSHELCSVGRGDLARATHQKDVDMWKKPKPPKHLLSESRSRALVFLRPRKGSALTAVPQRELLCVSLSLL